MAKKLFITGTGTDIGKTYVTGLILKKLQESGRRAAYYKAAMSGNERDEEGHLIPGDALHVKTVSGITQPLKTMCPYVYEAAVSPHLASRLEGDPVQMDVVKEGFEKVCGAYDYVTVEGSGGINGVVLTAEYMRARDLELKGIIFNNFHPGDVMEEDNIRMCEYYTELPTLACVKPGDTALDMSADALAALYSE